MQSACILIFTNPEELPGVVPVATTNKAWKIPAITVQGYLAGIGAQGGPAPVIFQAKRKVLLPDEFT